MLNCDLERAINVATIRGFPLVSVWRDPLSFSGYLAGVGSHNGIDPQWTSWAAFPTPAEAIGDLCRRLESQPYKKQESQ